MLLLLQREAHPGRFKKLRGRGAYRASAASRRRRRARSGRRSRPPIERSAIRLRTRPPDSVGGDGWSGRPTRRRTSWRRFRARRTGAARRPRCACSVKVSAQMPQTRVGDPLTSRCASASARPRTRSYPALRRTAQTRAIRLIRRRHRVSGRTARYGPSCQKFVKVSGPTGKKYLSWWRGGPITRRC